MYTKKRDMTSIVRVREGEIEKKRSKLVRIISQHNGLMNTFDAKLCQQYKAQKGRKTNNRSKLTTSRNCFAVHFFLF